MANNDGAAASPVGASHYGSIEALRDEFARMPLLEVARLFRHTQLERDAAVVRAAAALSTGAQCGVQGKPQDEMGRRVALVDYEQLKRLTADFPLTASEIDKLFRLITFDSAAPTTAQFDQAVVLARPRQTKRRKRVRN